MPSHTSSTHSRGHTRHARASGHATDAWHARPTRRHANAPHAARRMHRNPRSRPHWRAHARPNPTALLPARDRDGHRAMKPAQRIELFRRLRELDPHPTTELDYTTPFELLIAVILSAQATDVGVNK